MLKKSLALLVLALMVVSLNAQHAKKAPLKSEPANVTLSAPLTGGVPTYGPAAASWVAVDTMQNTFGPAIGALNPLAVDPATGTVAVLHRARTTYASSSGSMVYNYSTDGVTWTRVLPAVNGAQAQAGRYPSMTIYPSTSQGTLPVFSWPELVSGAFGGVGYGADASIGAGTPVAGILTDPVVLFSSQVPTFASANVALWASDNQTDASIKLFKTVDFQTVDTLTPPTWSSASFDDGGNVTFGGVAGLDNTLYYGVAATFPGLTPIQSGWYPGYSKSTDNGATWSAWNVVDFRTIANPAISKFDRLWDYIKGDNFVAYQGDINVDANGRVHMLVTVTDTTVDNNSGENALIELFETASGWDAKIIMNGLSDSSFTKLDGPGLGQMGPNAYLAFDATRQVMAATWVNPNPSIANDSLCDLWMSYRHLNGEWSTPINLTETSGMNENSTHMAPMLTYNAASNKYAAYVFYNYPAGYTGHFPNGTSPDYTTQPSVIYVAKVEFDNPAVGVEDENLPNGFALSQNYPNPFNPSTSISFMMAQTSKVSLKVYDMMGSEVATLVDGVIEAGSHTVNFDASNLASGMYIYKLASGNFVETKKMMLLK